VFSDTSSLSTQATESSLRAGRNAENPSLSGRAAHIRKPCPCEGPRASNVQRWAHTGVDRSTSMRVLAWHRRGRCRAGALPSAPSSSRTSGLEPDSATTTRVVVGPLFPPRPRLDRDTPASRRLDSQRAPGQASESRSTASVSPACTRHAPSVPLENLDAGATQPPIHSPVRSRSGFVVAPPREYRTPRRVGLDGRSLMPFFSSLITTVAGRLALRSRRRSLRSPSRASLVQPDSPSRTRGSSSGCPGP